MVDEYSPSGLKFKSPLSPLPVHSVACTPQTAPWYSLDGVPVDAAPVFRRPSPRIPAGTKLALTRIESAHTRLARESVSTFARAADGAPVGPATPGTFWIEGSVGWP